MGKRKWELHNYKHGPPNDFSIINDEMHGVGFATKIKDPYEGDY